MHKHHPDDFWPWSHSGFVHSLPLVVYPIWDDGLQLEVDIDKFLEIQLLKTARNLSQSISRDFSSNGITGYHFGQRALALRHRVEQGT